MSNLFPGAVALTNEEYHANTTHVSKSGLDLIARSPLHYWERYLNPMREAKEKSDALIMGSAIHAAILEPHLFDSEFFSLNDADKCEEIGGASPRATKAYKEWKAEQLLSHEGKQLLSHDQIKTVEAMKAAFFAHATAPRLVGRGFVENSFFFTEPTTGAPCKFRPDYVGENLWVVDLKSTEDASPKGFGKSIANFNYLKQGAFICDGLANLGHKVKGFIFIAVEKEPPYGIGIYYMTSEHLEMGRAAYRRDCAVYMHCLKTGTWPGYNPEPVPIDLPGWAYTK